MTEISAVDAVSLRLAHALCVADMTQSARILPAHGGQKLYDV